MDNKNNATQTSKRKRKDPRLTVGYYSMYQNWKDVLVSILICMFAMLIAVLVITLVYLLVISPHPTLNIFYMLSKLFEFITTAFIRLIRDIYSMLYL